MTSRTLIIITSYLIDFTTSIAECVMIAVAQIFSLIEFQSRLCKCWVKSDVYQNKLHHFT